MKIVFLSTSACQGGAAIVTANLAESLARRGHAVEFITMEGKRETKPSFLAEHLEILLRNGMRRDTLFKLSTARFGRRGIVERVRRLAPDAIVLSWVNQGFLSLGQIEKLARMAPTAWIMHDMWNCTGVCHHSLGCMRFCAECGNCPMIAPALRGRNDLSHKVWEAKRRLYAAVPIKFVAVSHWLESQARRSSLLRDADVSVIHNIYPLHRFKIARKEPGLIAMGAERLDDPIKGLDYAIDALNRLPEGCGARVVFFGSLRDSAPLQRLRVPYELTGPLDADAVGRLLGRAQVVLSSSLYESLPTTLIEGQASGAMPVSFDRGGQSDIIDHMHSGYLAPFGDVDALARGIEWGLSGRISPESLRDAAESKFSAHVVAAAYEALLTRGEGRMFGGVC